MTGMSTPLQEPLVLVSARARAVLVPLAYPLGTSAAIVRAAPLVLVDVETAQGITGRAYVFGYTAAGARAVVGTIHEAFGLIAGQVCNPPALAGVLARRYALLGVTGVVRMALSALDIAFWDAVARWVGQPLAEVLGCHRRDIPAYDSRGLGLKPPDALADEARSLAEAGLGAIKLRLGYDTLAEDLAALRAVRRVLPDRIALMVDYNQALLPTEALARGLALQSEGVVWLEEPIRHDDYRACARIAARLDLPVQIGENFNGPSALREALAQEACDLVMPDVARIGGVTGWMQAAALASASGVPLSSHLMPEISLHLLAATPTAHWLEWVDWASDLLVEPLTLHQGRAVLPDRPGLGLDWNEARIARLQAL